MGRPRWAGSLLLALVAASCSTTSMDAGRDDSEPSPPSAPPACVGWQVEAEYPADCSVIAPVDGLPGLIVRYEPADGQEATLHVATRAGAPTSVTEVVGPTSAGPRYDDINADGIYELVIPLGLGNANPVSSVWTYEDGRFGRAGELDGSVVSTEGYIVVLNRSDAATYVHTFFELIDAELRPVASAIVSFGDDQGRFEEPVCEVVDEGGLSALQLSPAEEHQTFCNHHGVAS